MINCRYLYQPPQTYIDHTQMRSCAIGRSPAAQALCNGVRPSGDALFTSIGRDLAKEFNNGMTSPDRASPHAIPGSSPEGHRNVLRSYFNLIHL